ncbi:two-component system, chemotaxis family, response regulator CheY [Tranquillimonas rosea]|uniref:Two-component system, chemotaxis family, response regulator CheY n=1 Tax=Tranquillimonas rosea TaxID=641238 RepID=A0A1H9RDR1_9RHOB|nr:response regulator [Tranquillimonas rosea]SER70842.1 two-component system, chemotaxis family, response regulator CheY [Tranquillimonas rosea]
MSRTVLVADDSPSVRRMIVLTLRGAGYAAIEAENGQEALDVATTHSVDAVITDQNMPRLDGLGFARAFRARPEGRGVPIVFLSTESDPALREQARAAGAIGWMVKPFDQAKLLDVMRRVVG